MSWCVACIVQVLGRMLWRGVRQAVLQVHGCRKEQVWRDHIMQAEHEELLRQYGDQTNLVSEHWLGETNFPRLESQVSSGSLTQASGTTTWAMVAGRHAALSCTPGMPERQGRHDKDGDVKDLAMETALLFLPWGQLESVLCVHLPWLGAFPSATRRLLQPSSHGKAKPKRAAKNHVAKVPGQAPAVLQNEHQ